LQDDFGELMATLVKRTKGIVSRYRQRRTVPWGRTLPLRSASAQASGSGSSFWVFGQQALGGLAFVRMRFGMGAGTAGTGFGASATGLRGGCCDGSTRMRIFCRVASALLAMSVPQAYST
jgi:hypothetical protein